VFDRETLKILKSPQGKLIKPDELFNLNLKEFTTVTLVGDVITHHFLNHGLHFDKSIIDGVSQKYEQVPLPERVIHLHKVNPPGSISKLVSAEIIELFNNHSDGHTIIKVDGEEDLLAFIPVLIQPLNSLVLYGQPDGGIVMIQVGESEKLKMAQFIDRQFNG